MTKNERPLRCPHGYEVDRLEPDPAAPGFVVPYTNRCARCGLNPAGLAFQRGAPRCALPSREALPPAPKVVSPVALVIGPWRRRSRADSERMELILNNLLDAGWVPVFYPPALAPVLDETVPQERSVALMCSQVLVQALAVSPWPVEIFVDVHLEELSSGMNRDLSAWASRTSRTIHPAPVTAEECEWAQDLQRRVTADWAQAVVGAEDREAPRASA